MGRPTKPRVRAVRALLPRKNVDTVASMAMTETEGQESQILPKLEQVADTLSIASPYETRVTRAHQGEG